MNSQINLIQTSQNIKGSIKQVMYSAFKISVDEVTDELSHRSIKE